MTGWNEDNFLERLLAKAREQHGADRGPCPDAETLCSVLEGDVPAPLRQFVVEHVRHCPDCAVLESRLLNFEAGASPEPEAVWKETRKRLDNWLEGFLRSEAVNLRASRPTSAPGRSPGRDSFWSLFNSRKLIWGLGVVGLAVLIGDAILVLELRRGQPNHAQIIARSAAPKPQAANVRPAAPPSSAAVSNQARRIEVGRAPEVSTSPSQKSIARTSETQARPQATERASMVAARGGSRLIQESGPQAVAETPPSNPQTALAQGAGPPASQPAAPVVPSAQDNQPPILSAQAVPPPREPAAIASPGSPAGPQPLRAERADCGTASTRKR